MSDSPRWRSRAVELVLLGSAGSLVTLLGGCTSNIVYSNDYQRNVYASAADCAQDYGLGSCTARIANGSQYLGPPYRVLAGIPVSCHASDPGPGRLRALSPRLEVVRGGFGPRCRQAGSSSRSWRSSSWGRSWGG